LADQQRIAAKVDELMALCSELEAAQNEREERRDALRKVTLQRLTSNYSDRSSGTQDTQFFLQQCGRFTTKPEHVAEVRHSILDLAVSGKLVAQDPGDEPASEILREIDLNGRMPMAIDPVPQMSLPTGWLWVRVDDVFKVTGGIQKQPKRTPASNAFPYLGVSNVQRGRLELDSVARFELFPGELEKLRLEPGDLLIVEGNGSANEIGRCARWNGEIDDCVHQNHIIRCRPLCDGLEQFVLLYLNSPSGTETMRRLAITTAGLYNLSVGKIKSIVIPLPPLVEQRRIVAKANEMMSACDQLEAAMVDSQTRRSRFLEALLYSVSA
jgi:type I restriction enzyme S subunit